MKVKIIILQALLIAQNNCAVLSKTCSQCQDTYTMCQPSNNNGYVGKCCHPTEKSAECQDNQYGTPYNICTPQSRREMGELWYSYCPRPADSKCGDIKRTIDSVENDNIKQSQLSLLSINKDYCFYEISINSQKIKPIDTSKGIKISIRIMSADDMNVYIYQGNDRTILKKKSENDGKFTTSTLYEIDGSKGAMILAYPSESNRSVAKGSINIQYNCTNCEVVKLMQFGGWQAALIINVLIIMAAILWCVFVKCGKQNRGRDQVYCEEEGNTTEVKLVESKTKKMYMFHNSRVENPKSQNKLFVEELTVSQYGRKVVAPTTKVGYKSNAYDYNMTQNNMTLNTGAADNTSSHIDLGRDLVTTGDLFSKKSQLSSPQTESKQQADLYGNDQNREQGQSAYVKPKKESKQQKYQKKKKQENTKQAAKNEINNDIDQYESELNNLNSRNFNNKRK